MARTFSRKEFYELVWSKPMTQLSKEFLISDVALHKICKKNDIPNPPLGWWAKKAAGKPVVQTPLAPGQSSSDTIVIVGADNQRTTPLIAAAREQARILASQASEAAAGLSDPVVDATITRLRQGKPEESGLVTCSGKGLISCAVAPASIDRLHEALPRIVAAAAQQGFKLNETAKPVHFLGVDATVSFSINEEVKREDHVLTEAEQAKDDAWQAKLEKARKKGDWSYVLGRPVFQKWDYHPSGVLSFELEHVYVREGAAPRRTFRDAKTQRLETMAPEIAVGLAVLAAAKKDKQEKAQETERRRKKDQQEKEEAARLEYVTKRRSEALNSILEDLHELDRLKQLLSTLQKQIGSSGTRVAAFMQFAERYVLSREEELSAEGLELRFEDEEIFGDADDRDFSLRRWY
ncbi:hypothetical protein [Tianweitania sp.]|uniref:hypothetical protein n=1 Tax=Tianweitania sp. TaxID=2021634 RepID=UPI00289FA8B4|nr:hypothetical protein [Tianweitania sp.]